MVDPQAECTLTKLGLLGSWQHGSPYGPMDKAPAYGAGDSGFESQYGLLFLFQGWKKTLKMVVHGT